MSHFQKVVGKDSADTFYMKVKIDFENAEVQIDKVKFKALVIAALHQLHGETGASIPVDVLQFKESSMEAILRVSGRSFVKLWSALTVLGNCGPEACAVHVTQVSPHLLALAVDSRHFFDELLS